LLPSFDSRSGSTTVDAKLVNGFMEKDQQGEWWVNKRPGLVIAGEDAAAGSASCLGIYYWERFSNFYLITATGLLREDFTTTVGTVISSPSFVYDFNELITDTLFLKNRTKAYKYVGGVLSQITTPDYPGNSYPLVPGSVNLDGTMYVMDYEARIYGSGLNDLDTWDPLNVVRAQIEPDGGRALAKQGSYVVAFKAWTIEFFYNAGAYSGTLTGSTLLPVANAKLPMGYNGGLQSVDDVLYFVGRNKTIGPGVYSIAGLKLSKISTYAVDKLLEEAFIKYSWQVRLGGHTFYALQVYALDTTTLLHTVVYDITAGVWQFWKENGAAFDVQYSIANLYDRVNYLQGAEGSVTRGLGPEIYTDTLVGGGTAAIEVDAITPIFDAGSNLGKVLSKLRIVADQNSGGSLQIRWSDNDYKDWTNWITVNLQDDVPFLTNLGKFTKRAFQYRHVSPAPFRMSAFEVDLLLCSI